MPLTLSVVFLLQTCDNFRKIAAIFHEKVTIVDEAVREALAKHKAKAQEIINFVKQYLVEKANNFQCTDVLSADVRMNSFVKPSAVVNFNYFFSFLRESYTLFSLRNLYYNREIGGNSHGGLSRMLLNFTFLIFVSL